MSKKIIQDRIATLEANIQNIYDKIGKYEELRDLEDDPMKRDSHNNTIQELNERIKEYNEQVEKSRADLQKELDEESKGKDNIPQPYDIKYNEIPFVVAVMNRRETSALIMKIQSELSNGICTIRKEDCDKFKALIEDELGNPQKINEWMSHYDDSRDKWEPHIYPSKTIYEIISSIIERINQERILYRDKSDSIEWIRLRTYSEEFFGSDRDKRDDAWDKMKQSGSILVIDAISLFHPAILKTLDKSGITSNKDAAIIVLSPVDSSSIPPNNKIELFMREEMPVIMSQADKRLDSLCKIGVGDHRDLQQWIFSKMPKIEASLKNYRGSKSKRDFRNWHGKPPGEEGPGVSEAIFQMH